MPLIKFAAPAPDFYAKFLRNIMIVSFTKRDRARKIVGLVVRGVLAGQLAQTGADEFVWTCQGKSYTFASNRSQDVLSAICLDEMSLPAALQLVDDGLGMTDLLERELTA